MSNPLSRTGYATACLLAVSLTTAFVLPTSSFTPRAAAASPFTIPPSPSLAGASVRVQAFGPMGDPFTSTCFAFSNDLSVTIL
ncbi:MAG: hypothetical protein ACREIU_15885 [Planctomycetota bacterium]